MLGQSITRNGLILAAFAVATALLIAGTYLQTRERISEEQRAAEERALLQIVPREAHDNSLLDDTLPAPVGDDKLKLAEPRPIYRARRDGRVETVLVPARAPDGYSGAIDLVVGVERDGSIAGVRVLAHRETPGLGDKIDRRKGDWIDSFAGRSLKNPAPAQWKVSKDKGVFDTFTGATITPRAVVAATRRTLEYVKANEATLFAGDAAATGTEKGP
ncbi:electron transport complex subunit RsxG [Pseudohaliea rubra]|uniref:electron transport complex subunit RsxG n=1 Tax=Pseudohaliea rubra TaxID=475795 RepID=UPI00055478E0|nr:electron transport complex subunit RsxG [Pseudohaliea rubra]